MLIILLSMENNDIVPGFDDESDENLSIRLARCPDISSCLTISLNGYIDTYNSASFQKRILKAISSGFLRIIFDCNSLNYVSSTGIGSFTTFLKMVTPRGGDIIMLNVQPKISEVFQILGFSQFFNLKHNLEDALNFFKGGKNKIQSHVFPKIFGCPICSSKLKAVKAGRFRCSQCKTILLVDNSGQVLLG